MMNDNYFFGRARELERLRQDVFFPSGGDYGRYFSLCGPHGIGKTYLIHQLMEEYEAAMEGEEDRRSFCFYRQLPNSGSEDPLVDFKCRLLSDLADALPLELLRKSLTAIQGDEKKLWKAQNALENLEIAYALVGPEGMCDPEDKNRYRWWSREIDKCFESDTDISVFQMYTILGFRVILLLDEFDRAENGFPSGDIFQWLFSLSNKSSTGRNLNLSIGVISRRRPATFTGSMNDGSDFEAAYPPMVLSGFSNDDLDGPEGYFASFGRPLSEAVKSRIQFYCGRHPALLMDMRREVLRSQDPEPDVDAIWNSSPSFARVYNKMCGQMESDSLRHRFDVTLMDAFMYRFVYFAGAEDAVSARDPDQQLYAEKLVDAGFAIRPDWSRSCLEDGQGRYYPDIFFRAGEKDRNAAREPLFCEPLSPFFLSYVQSRWKPEKGKGAAQHLGWTEQALRHFLADRLKSRYKTYWNEAVRAVFNPAFKGGFNKMDTFLKNLEKLASENHYTGELSSLDVLSFNDYYAVLQFHWDTLFQKDFASYGAPDQLPLNALREDFRFLTNCRNAKAHENLKVLNASSIQRVQKVCTLLDAIIEGNTAG